MPEGLRRAALHAAKIAVFRAARETGLFRVLLDSRWRRARLCILCYHGVSIADEHDWNGRLYLSQERFQERLRTLERLRCRVLPLNEALERLRVGELPPRSVAITFDDGFHDFLTRAHPVLAQFGYPATVYLTTYYSEHNVPVFRLMCSYLLWRARGRNAELKAFTGHAISVGTGSAEDRDSTLALIDEAVAGAAPDARAKQHFVEELAGALNVDLAALSAQRILHLLTPDEARRLDAAGIDIQLHTHRHRTPRDEDLFRREILDNREAIQRATGKTASHFCYPSGVYREEFLPWLRALQVVSATTCEPGLGTGGTEPLQLPRYLDQQAFTETEFEAWVSGAAAIGR
jgi:peptidoglycan/xylan/chitin deacetylase (PgdA/CDA1 family)